MVHSLSARSRLKAWVVVGAMLLGAGAGLLSGACSGDGESVVGPTGTGAAGNASGGGHGGEGNLFGGNGGYAPVVSIQITPADPVIVVDNGVIPPPTVFAAVGITGSGDTVPLSGSWSYDRYDLGSIDSVSGSFTAAGLLGGTGTVTFSTPNLSGTTTATVKLHLTSDPESVDPSIKALFNAASADDPAMTLLYPYDKTVFPRGLPGPILQWNGGAATDIYYVHAYSPTFELESWGTVPPPSRYSFPAVPSDSWRVLTDSTTGAITLDVQRYDGAQAYLPKSETWTIAPANLAGIVYYWSISSGAVVRIPIGASVPETFITPSATHTCVACHSVSAQGNRIVAAYDGGWSPWVTFDAATGAELYYSGQSSGFEAISPDGSYVVWRHWSDGAFNTAGSLVLSHYNDATPLTYLNPGSGAPSHPAWSTDGSKIAFSVRTDGNGLQFSQASLWTSDVDVNAPAFSNIHQIVANDASRPTVTYPTFSPGSDWIAFMRGNYAYCNSGSVGFPVLGDIWLTNLDGSTQINLDALNGHGIVASPDDSYNYTPSFLPVTVGGYMWLVFATERNYGNIISWPPSDFADRPKQLWVAAIDVNPQSGQDPSHPAFWLPGQELATENMRGQWALAPCKQLGEECDAGYECCDGFCRADDGGHPVCQNQPGPCSQSGEACNGASDCCDPQAQCIGGYCNTPPPT